MGSQIAVPLLVILGLIISAAIYTECQINDCEPFGGKSTEDRMSAAKHNAEATGIAKQLFYGTRVGDKRLLDALRLYAYCDQLPDEQQDSEYCASAPAKEEIVSTIEGFRPHPREPKNAVKELLPFTKSMAFRVSVDREGVTLIDTGHNTDSAKTTSDTSTFIVVEPLPGGNHLRVEFTVNNGRITTGVIKQ